MENKMIQCACGCGETLLEWKTCISPVRKQVWFMYKRKFIKGHSTRGKLNPMYGKPGARLGMKNTIAHNKAISDSNKGRPGKIGKEIFFYDKHFNGPLAGRWTGGKNGWWRKEILKRDNFTCQICGLRDKEIMQVDHIKNKKQFPKLEYDLSNGRCLCPNCHERKSIKEKGRSPFLSDKNN